MSSHVKKHLGTTALSIHAVMESVPSSLSLAKDTQEMSLPCLPYQLVRCQLSNCTWASADIAQRRATPTLEALHANGLHF